MNIETPGKNEKKSIEEETQELERFLMELDQKAGEIGEKLADSSWLSPLNGESMPEAQKLAITQMIKTIVYGLTAVISTLALTGSKTGAWVAGGLVGIQQFSKALHYLNNELQLGDLRSVLQELKQALGKK